MRPWPASVQILSRSCMIHPRLYSKPSLIRIEIWQMKSAVHSWVHTLKDTWHLGRQMSHLSVQTEFDSFLQACIITSRNKYNFWAVYRWINVLSCYSFLHIGSTVIFCYLFSPALFLSLNFPFICVLSFFFCLLGLPFASLTRIIA
jgi:hypothetical protein